MAVAKGEQNSLEPNVVIPLALSYNQRNIRGFTEMVTNSVDQRKVNFIYEPVSNALSGNTTVYLVTRPGCVDTGSSYGTTGQLAYLHEVAAGASTSAAANRWVFSRSTNDIRASDASTTTVVVTAAGYAPAYVDKGIFGGTEQAILQLRNASGTQRVFYSSAIGVWTEINDADFTGLAHRGKMEFGPGRAHIMAGNNRIYSSDLDSLTSWSASTFLTKQVEQDIGTGLARFGQLYVAFGENTFEIFHDIGNPTGSPLESMPSKMQRFGLESQIVTDRRHYYAVLGKQLYWVGTPTGVYVYDGERVEKVSTPAIDKVLAQTGYYHVGKVTFQGQEAICVAITDVDDTTQRGLLFFPKWNDWFEWRSTKVSFITGQRLENVFLGVGSSQHKLYAISEAADNWLDDGVSQSPSVTFQLPSTGNHVKRMPFCGVIADTARSTQSLNVSWSDDDYVTFSTARAIDMTSKTKMIKRCGSFRNRVITLAPSSENLPLRLDKFIARVD